MGIPHLITYLRPYATTVTLDGHSSSDSSIAPPSRQVIIDGPGLTYYVYYTYVAISGSLHHPLTTASLHEHIGQAIIAWLDQLRGCGIEMYPHKPRSRVEYELIILVVIESISMVPYHHPSRTFAFRDLRLTGIDGRLIEAHIPIWTSFPIRKIRSCTRVSNLSPLGAPPLGRSGEVVCRLQPFLYLQLWKRSWPMRIIPTSPKWFLARLTHIVPDVQEASVA